MSPIRWLSSVVCLAAVSAAAGLVASDPGSEGQRIVEVLRLAPGMVAADVGAGEGKWTSVLARGVGAGGSVDATEITQHTLDEVKERMAADGIHNVVTVLCDQRQTGLPRACCDRVLLRLVYITSRSRRRCSAAFGPRCGPAA